MYDFHMKVNEKLKKPTFTTAWELTVFERKDSLLSLIRMLTLMVWNYPAPEDWKREKYPSQNNEYLETSSKYLYDKQRTIDYYKLFFIEILPQIIEYTQLSMTWNTFIEIEPMTDLIFLSQVNFVRWFTGFRKLIKETSFPELDEKQRVELTNLWDYDDISIFVRAIRAKEDCGKGAVEGTIFQGCQ
jgi:hypothetical protein